MMMSIYNLLVLVVAALLPSIHAATVTYDFNITWTLANPDGLFTRAVIGVNGKWPPPTIYATKGDQVVVNVKNQLGNQTTGLHFHGIFQNGTTEMDGAAYITQCPIQPGGSLTYNFTIDQPGTYWYHSHARGQYPDGIRAALIINDPDTPFKGQYDDEVILTFSDWYHDDMTTLIKQFLNVGNPTGAEPVPDSALMNDTQNLKIPIKPGKTYLFRMVNIGAFAGQYIWVEGHKMTIVEVDGVYTQPAAADMIYMSAAQRYGVLITTKNDTSANFPITGSMDQSLFDVVPDSLNPNVTSWLQYDSTKPFPIAQTVDMFDDFDDFTLVPYDKEPRLPQSTNPITLDLAMINLANGENYAAFNGISWVEPKVPTIFSALSLGGNATNPMVYGENTHALVLNGGEVVEIILNNNDPGKHPIHLHGHNFQVITRSDDNAGDFNGTGDDDTPAIPMRRDVVVVNPNGNFRIRFVASNPGIWLFHCHIEWHMLSGLSATVVENPLYLQKNLKIPADHYAACKAGNIATTGNAVGNVNDPFDLSGENAPPGPLPSGFTPRGIVALVFSVVAAFLGLAVISWYGYAPIVKR